MKVMGAGHSEAVPAESGRTRFGVRARTVSIGLGRTDQNANCRRSAGARLRGALRVGGAAEQAHEPLVRVGAVAVLRAESLRLDDDDAAAAHTPAGQGAQAHAHGVRDRRRARGVEAQLHGGRDLVDVLAAGARGGEERELDLALAEP